MDASILVCLWHVPGVEITLIMVDLSVSGCCVGLFQGFV